MKFIKTIAILAVAFATTQVASAISVHGSIGFSASSWSGTDNDADSSDYELFDVSGAFTIGAATGTYSGVPNFTAVNFNQIDLDATSGAIWDFGIYTFTATSYTVTRNENSNPGGVSISGVGIATATGYDDGFGTFQITANNDGASFTLSSSAQVPDSGASALLLGLGLAGLGAAMCRFKR